MVSTEERIKALATYLGVEEDEITEGYDDTVFEVNGEEYRVLDDDEADEAVVNDIESLIDDIGLEAFTPAMRDWIVENAIYNVDWFDDALEDDMNFYVSDLSDDEVVEIINKSRLKDVFGKWANMKDVKVSKNMPGDYYWVRSRAKIRYIDPLVNDSRISSLSENARKNIANNFNYDMENYVYSDSIKLKKLEK